jgi:polar amino acid transport system substrate-binding protein
MNSSLFKFLGGVIFAAAVAFAVFLLPESGNFLSAKRDNPGCGSVYRVVAGDTLHEIAVKAYGAGDYGVILRANRGTLTDASRIEIGQELFLPCRDGVDGPGTLAALIGQPTGSLPDAASDTRVASASAVMPLDRAIGLVTGSNFAPFVDASQPEGGMIAEMLRLAIANTGPDRGPGHSAKVEFVDDWRSHFDRLQARDFDIGFPWYRPDCTKAEALDASMQRRCTEFDFSDPLFEVSVGYYTRTGSPLAGAAAYDQLAGRRLCRPANFFTFDLEQEGLTGPDATLVVAPKLSDCFTWLLRGDVDVVTLSEQLAEDEILRLGLDGDISEIPGLASVQTLHAVTPKNHPNGAAYLDMINSGLAELKASGRWFEIATRHLSTYGMSVR